MRVVALDLAGMVAGTKYRGEFEQRLTAVIDEVVAARRSVVVFVDELHAVVGAGAAEGGAMDAGTILKPALARGELQMIGATTLREYRRHIEKDPALERRFEPVRVQEPTVEQTVEILRGLRERYERHHGCVISDAALEAAAALSDRYVRDRFLPDKAIDLVDRAASRLRLRTPTPALGLEERFEQLTRARDVAVDAEDYERAEALTRELEGVAAELATARRGASDEPELTADDVAAAVARRDGHPGGAGGRGGGGRPGAAAGAWRSSWTGGSSGRTRRWRRWRTRCGPGGRGWRRRAGRWGRCCSWGRPGWGRRSWRGRWRTRCTAREPVRFDMARVRRRVEPDAAARARRPGTWGTTSRGS